ncbi:MAG: c-type cytochrome, partial [Planctomycetes bacterium]|nr:c-type cytochrome [Planctomycetota bacterium]
GTTNPWGLDFDEHGEMFITNCVIDHLWHIVPGGHYQRMFGNDFNPHLYKLMPSICDHIHWGGGNWTSSRAPTGEPSRVSDRVSAYKVHSEAGGGHAHVGCMIYLGDNWPDRYRNGVFMCNLHGNRINHDILERNGSTYVARHAKDFMLANDQWFRGLALHYGPDGGVYVADWTDTGECHNYQVADKTTGRIFKITYDESKLERRLDDIQKEANALWKSKKKDFANCSDEDLARLQAHDNCWVNRHARRMLQERAALGKISPKAITILKGNIRFRDRNPNLNLRSLWALYVINQLDGKDFDELLNSKHEQIRAWTVRFLLDGENGDRPNNGVFWDIARNETSSLVRMHLASGLQRETSHKFARSVIVELLKREQDARDPYLPLMYWYTVDELISSKVDVPFGKVDHWLITEWMFRERGIPLVREFSARRFIQMCDKADECVPLNQSIDLIASKDDPAFHRDFLRGIHVALEGRRKVKMPPDWEKAYPILIESPLPEVRERALALAVQFGDERAFTLLRKIVPDRAQPVKQREDALKTLLFQQKPDLVPILHDLLGDESLRGPAIRGLAAFDDPRTPKLLLKDYARYSADEKNDALQTLASRGPFALALLDAIDAKAIPRQDINSYTIRQLQTLKHPDLPAKLAKVWGEVRPASADKAKLMAKYKAELKPDVLKKANLANGRALYAKACASCHRLFGEGSDIGPDLTGSQRMNLDYVLENVLDPSAIVPREYQVTVIETKAGRTLSGIVKKENDASVTLQLQNEVVVIPKADIDTRTATKQSMMPDGAFEQLRIEEVRDLIGYLASPVQVQLKK